MGQSLSSSSSKGPYYLTWQRKENNENGVAGEQPFPRGLTGAGHAGRGLNGREEVNTQPGRQVAGGPTPESSTFFYDLPLWVSVSVRFPE